jgi:hypothetical protein
MKPARNSACGGLRSVEGNERGKSYSLIRYIREKLQLCSFYVKASAMILA